MKGCVRGYGNYEELTSSGVDPTELFDDIEDCGKSPDLVQPDIVIEECDDVVEEDNFQDIKSPDHIHLLPTDNTRKRIHSRHSESDVDPVYNPVLDGGSVCTSPSMLSLISLPNIFENKKEKNIVVIIILCILSLSNNTTYC